MISWITIKLQKRNCWTSLKIQLDLVWDRVYKLNDTIWPIMFSKSYKVNVVFALLGRCTILNLEKGYEDSVLFLITFMTVYICQKFKNSTIQLNFSFCLNVTSFYTTFNNFLIDSASHLGCKTLFRHHVSLDSSDLS